MDASTLSQPTAEAIAPAGWQPAAVERLRRLLEGDEAVLALVLFGSLGQAGRPVDWWSDIDALVVVREAAFARFYPALDWLAPLGLPFAWEQHADQFRGVTRLCLRDLRRYDLIITTETGIARAAEWPRLPYWQGSRTLFSRSASVDAALVRPTPPATPSLSDAALDELANRFWFKATLAVAKLARRDALVALDLTLAMERDCLLLAMRLRDRGDAASGSARLPAHPVSAGAAGLLDRLVASADLFDGLAGAYSPRYQSGGGPLRSLIKQARSTIARDAG